MADNHGPNLALPDDAAAGPVAYRAAGEVLQWMRFSEGFRDAAAQRVAGSLMSLSEEDLQGVQLLGEALAAYAAAVREARRDRG